MTNSLLERLVPAHIGRPKNKIKKAKIAKRWRLYLNIGGQLKPKGEPRQIYLISLFPIKNKCKVQEQSQSTGLFFLSLSMNAFITVIFRARAFWRKRAS